MRIVSLAHTPAPVAGGAGFLKAGAIAGIPLHCPVGSYADESYVGVDPLAVTIRPGRLINLGLSRRLFFALARWLQCESRMPTAPYFIIARPNLSAYRSELGWVM